MISFVRLRPRAEPALDYRASESLDALRPRSLRCQMSKLSRQSIMNRKSPVMNSTCFLLLDVFTRRVCQWRRAVFLLQSRRQHALLSSLSSAMSQTSITGLLRLCSVDARDETSLEEIDVYRKDRDRNISKKWYKTSLEVGNCTQKMGFLHVNASDDHSEGRLLHRVCYVSGGLSYGTANTSEIRFVIDAKELLPFDMDFDARNETLALPHSISTTGLCRPCYDSELGLYYETYVMNSCIYSGRSYIMRLMYVGFYPYHANLELKYRCRCMTDGKIDQKITANENNFLPASVYGTIRNIPVNENVELTVSHIFFNIVPNYEATSGNSHFYR